MGFLRVDKIASVVTNLDLRPEVEISDACVAAAGNVVVVRALEEKRVYDTLELVGGRMAKISKGDLIVGALGARRALKGFMGDVPSSLALRDRIHILNLGGVIGLAPPHERLDIGRPLSVEVLGMAVRGGRVLNIADGALPLADQLLAMPPVVMVSGTCMNSGKTYAASAIIQHLTQRGRRVAAAKVSGVACLKDTYAMRDHGAVDTLSFLDCGLASTVGRSDLNRVAKALLNTLVERNPGLDAVVVEMGDGIIGRYGLPSVFNDQEILSVVRCHVVTANDLVAAWGAVGVMNIYGITIDVMAGPATDNDVGTEYIRSTLKIEAANAHGEPRSLADVVERALAAHHGEPATARD
ncbi:MAG: hypothetical protein HY722_15740 [Planctomycetes bacterium]|nr:hypothetical protein [Planctomycetota bacterium]